MSPPTSKVDAQPFLGILGFGEIAYSKFQPDCKPTLSSDPKKNQRKTKAISNFKWDPE